MAETKQKFPSTGWWKITPAMAQQLLAKNAFNRKLDNRYADTLARDMLAGRWLKTGETIKLSTEGRLLDGQHRLYACVTADVPFETMVICDVDPDSQLNMDLGKKRTLSNQLSLMGYHNATNIAALVRAVHTWEHGTEAMRASILRANTNATYAELLETFAKHPELVQVVEVVKNWRQIPLSTNLLALTYWLFSTIDEADCEFFFDKLQSGAELAADSPIYRLRETAFENSRRPSNKLDQPYLAAITIKAWNLYRDGQPAPVQGLRWRRGGSSPESFPTPN